MVQSLPLALQVVVRAPIFAPLGALDISVVSASLVVLKLLKPSLVVQQDVFSYTLIPRQSQIWLFSPAQLHLEHFQNSPVGALGTLVRRLKNSAFHYQLQNIYIIVCYSRDISSEIQATCISLLG